MAATLARSVRVVHMQLQYPLPNAPPLDQMQLHDICNVLKQLTKNDIKNGTIHELRSAVGSVALESRSVGGRSGLGASSMPSDIPGAQEATAVNEFREICQSWCI